MAKTAPHGSGPRLSRRAFLATTALASGGLALGRPEFRAIDKKYASRETATPITENDLPAGSAPLPIDLPHFPDRLHAFLWRNWQLVPCQRLAEVIEARPADVRRVASMMGLPRQPRISADQLRRSALTIIKRNWHLLPYKQLLHLLGWTAEQLAFSLREDDFLYVKLGNLKPRCACLRYTTPDEAARRRARAIAEVVAVEFPNGLGVGNDPLFSFVAQLSARSSKQPAAQPSKQSSFSPRFCYSYFALYGDPLLDPAADPYPDGYLARLAASGVDGIWLQAVLARLAPFPWDPARSFQYEVRLRNLRALVQRARQHGIGVYLYLNEPRALPLAFFAAHPDLKGVVDGDHATLCTSQPQVRQYLQEAIVTVARAVPELAGIFTITASENLTSCWSHHHGEGCPRCGTRAPEEVIAELIWTFHSGLRQIDARTQLTVWDWGWKDEWAGPIIQVLPTSVALMSVSEWDLPIERGGVKSTVGEYSISAIGPGPRARRHWELARQRGLKTLAKIQAGNTWELSAVPYIPAVQNVAQHAANLRAARVDGLMLGWTLGGYPSPNLEVVAEIGRDPDATPSQAMERVARARFGAGLAPLVVRAWNQFSAAFRGYPFGTGLYSAPLQVGPANLLWLKPTGYPASMVGFPYDDLKSWCGNYPPEVFMGQLTKVADGFDGALAELKSAATSIRKSPPESRSLERELSVAEAAAIHFRSAALQCRFVLSRLALEQASSEGARHAERQGLGEVLRQEIALARRLYALQSADTRLGFEASNQYYYVPLDLVEKVLNCRDLLRTLPSVG